METMNEIQSDRPRRLRRARVRPAITMTCIVCGKRLSRYEEGAGLAQCYLCRNPGKISPRVLRRENRNWLAHDERMTDSVSMVPLDAAE